MGLIQGVLEAEGLATVGVSIGREITEKVGPPRTLYTPFPFGYPLGEAGNPQLQIEIIRRALKLFEAEGPPPVSAEFPEGA